LYVSTENPSVSFLYQYDLTAPNITNSKVLIDSVVSPSIGGDLKLATDGKIYWTTGYSYNLFFPFPYADTIYNQYNMNLNVINQPNNLGMDPDIRRHLCNFQPHSFYLGGKRTYWGLPNNPNYDMIAKGGSVCDTLGLPNSVNEVENSNVLRVYPNPASEFITLLYNGKQNSNISLQIADLTGRLVSDQILYSNKVDISSIPEGIYLLSLLENGQYHSSGRFTIIR